MARSERQKNLPASEEVGAEKKENMAEGISAADVAVEKMNVSAAETPARRDAPPESLSMSSWRIVWCTNQATSQQISPVASRPEKNEIRLIRRAADAVNDNPAKTDTSLPQIGWSGNSSASMPVHCVTSLADSPGNT